MTKKRSTSWTYNAIIALFFLFEAKHVFYCLIFSLIPITFGIPLEPFLIYSINGLLIYLNISAQPNKLIQIV